MRTYKTLGGALAAILLLILTQLIAQGAAGLLAMIKLPAGGCNIVAGILYAGLAYAALRLLSEKVLHEHTAALGMPKLHIQPRWAITAVLLPLAVTGCYLLLFRGTFVRADMRGGEVFSTLSAGIAFTSIAAGFVEEMVFRGVIPILLTLPSWEDFLVLTLLQVSELQAVCSFWCLVSAWEQPAALACLLQDISGQGT